MGKYLLICVIFIVAFNSCMTSKIVNQDQILSIYNEINKEIDGKMGEIVLEANINNEESPIIGIQDNFGVNIDPFTGKLFFRDYITFPYHSILKIKNAITGKILKIINTSVFTKSITIKTNEIEIDYFGWIKFNENLKENDEITIGTFIGDLVGGGDSGWVLKIRMRYKGNVIDPSIWFRYQENPTTGSS